MNVGVVEGRGSLRLALKTLQGLVIFAQPLVQELQRHKAVQLGVLSLGLVLRP